MPPTLEEMRADLQTAHDAGKTELAQRIADAIREHKAAHPDDVPRAPDFNERVAMEQRKMAREANPLNGMSRLEKFVAGNSQNLRSGSLGVKQFVNWASGNRIGDKDALQKEAAEYEKIDAPLLADPYGRGGQIVGQTAITAPFALATGAPAAAAVPVTLGINALKQSAAGIGGKAAAEAAAKEAATLPVKTAVARSAAFGAGEGALTTSGKDYSPNTNALFGAIGGAGGELGGRALGGVISPAMMQGKEVIKNQVKRLEDKGYPLVAKNLTDSTFIRGLTDTMQQLGMVPGVTKANEGQKKLYTKTYTKAAGVDPMENVGAGTGVDVMGPSAEKFRAFRKTPGDVPIGGLQGDIENFLTGNARVAAVTGQGQGAMLPRAVRNLADSRIGAPVSDASRGPPIMSTIDQAALDSNKTSAVPGLRDTLGDVASQNERDAIVPTMTRDEIMTARINLGRVANGPPGLEQQRARTMLNALESQYRQGVEPAERELFDQAKLEHGAGSDIVAAADPHKTVPLDPRRVATQTMSDEQRQFPKSDLHKLTMDLAARGSEPPTGWPRAAFIGMLGGVPAAGLGTSALSEDNGAGAALGLGIPAAAMWGLGSQSGRKYLANEALDPLAKELMSKLLATGGASIQR